MFEKIKKLILKISLKLKLPVIGIHLIELINNPIIKLSNNSSQSSWNEEGYIINLIPDRKIINKLVRSCIAIFDEKKNIIDEISSKANKSYFFNILTKEDIKEHSILKEFIKTPVLLKEVSKYLGDYKIHSFGLFYSKKNEKVDGSQLWHVDGDATKQLKLFVNINNVTEANGPFEFLKKNIMNFNLKNKGLLKLLNDEDVNEYVLKEKKVIFEGLAGENLLVDSSNCLHQGSRVKKGYRLMFMAQFLPVTNAIISKKTKSMVGRSSIYID